jgi:TolA-binding protein
LKKLVFLISFSTFAFADIYYAKVEPISTHLVKSNISGKVIKVNESLEGKVTDREIVVVESENEERELKSIQQKIDLLEDSIKFTRLSYENLEDILKRKRENYDKFQKLSSKSQVEKDREFYDLVSTENQYFALRESSINKRSQIWDLRTREGVLKKSIQDRTIRGNSLFVETIFVKNDDFVTMGTPIFRGQDLSKAKLTIFLKYEDLIEIENKKIFIDEVETDYKFSKIWQITDEKYISSYRAEIEIENPKEFSKLLKIEIK